MPLMTGSKFLCNCFRTRCVSQQGGSGDWIPKNAWIGDSSKILGEAISFLSFVRTKGWERQGWKHGSCKLGECFESRDTSLPSKDLATIHKEIRSHHNWNILKTKLVKNSEKTGVFFPRVFRYVASSTSLCWQKSADNDWVKGGNHDLLS